VSHGEERCMQSVAHMNADGLLRLADDICAYTTGVKGPVRDELLRLASHLRARAGTSQMRWSRGHRSGSSGEPFVRSC
jgi:hypothetical protein